MLSTPFPKTRIAVFVSGGGTNLQALIDAQNQGQLKSGVLTLVVSNHADAYAVTRARENGIPVCIVEKAGKSQEEFEQKLLAALRENEIDLIVLAGFMSILSASFTRQYEKRMINIHPSLIPSFCGKGFYGLKVHEAALAYGVKVTGATVHYVNEVPDGGEIIAQQPVRVLKSDTPQTLQRRVMEQAEWKLLPRAAEEVSRRLAKQKAK